MCYDAGLQEVELDHDVKMPPIDAARVPAAPSPDPVALAKAADALAAAERPIIIADFAARPPHGRDHAANLSMAPKECYEGADVVPALDIAGFEKPTHMRDIVTRTVVGMVPETATWIDIGFTDIKISKWSIDYGRTFHAQQRMTADPVIAAPPLVALLKERIVKTPGIAEKIAKRAVEIGKCHKKLRADWRKQAEKHWDEVPMTVPCLALEVWRAIKDEDWVLTAGMLHDWARRLWDFDRPYCHGGCELGTGTQIGHPDVRAGQGLMWLRGHALAETDIRSWCGFRQLWTRTSLTRRYGNHLIFRKLAAPSALYCLLGASRFG